MVGLLVGASIIENFGWHSTFLAIIPFSAVVTIMIAKFVREDKKIHHANSEEATDNTSRRQKSEHHFQYIKGVGALSVTITSFLIALTLIQIGVNSQNILQIAGSFVVSAISLSSFRYLEKDRASFSGLKVTKAQDPSTFIHLVDSGWYHHVYDLIQPEDS